MHRASGCDIAETRSPFLNCFPISAFEKESGGGLEEGEGRGRGKERKGKEKGQRMVEIKPLSAFITTRHDCADVYMVV